MPTRLYSCERDGEFEQQQRMSEAALKQCPKCGKCVPKRLIAGAPEFSLKEGPAGGWSTTGYGHTKQQLNVMRRLGKRPTPRSG